MNRLVKGATASGEGEEVSVVDHMVATGLWEIQLLEELDFDLIKISLKAYDIDTTVEAYRKLARMVPYPFHLGITEAGTARSGSIRSAIGLGTLLYDGIGDTIRVSLSDESREEVEVGYEILKALDLRKKGIQMVACPSCGRADVDIRKLANTVDEMLKGMDSPVKVAVMGCEVNGPGEAKDADVGIAAGNGRAVIFRKGQKARVVEESDMLSALLEGGAGSRRRDGGVGEMPTRRLSDVVTGIETLEGSLEMLEGVISFCSDVRVTYVGDDITYQPEDNSLVMILKELGESEEKIAAAQQHADYNENVTLTNIEELDTVVALLEGHLQGSTASYEPDSDGNLPVVFTKMNAAACLMFLALNRAGYCNPDARRYHAQLRQLYEYCRSSAPATHWAGLLPVQALSIFDAIDWLLSAIDIEVAVHDQNYEQAIHAAECFYRELTSLGSIEEELHRDLHNAVTSFPLRLKFQATLIYSLQPLVDWTEELRQRPFNEIDWMELLRLLAAAAKSYTDIPFYSLQEFDEEFYEKRTAISVNGQTADMHDYWLILLGWYEGVSSSSRRQNDLLALLTPGEDIQAEERLSRYFFDPTLWEQLTRRACAAFISADRAWVSGTSGRTEEIPNYLQVGAEDILYHHLWTPLLQWAEREPASKLSELREIQYRLNGKTPGLAEYRQLLLSQVAQRYLVQTGIEAKSDDMRLLTDPKRIPLDLQRLFNVRNDAQHKPDANISIDTLRKLYARFLGIHSKGVLPELGRLLVVGPRKALGSSSAE